MELGKLLLLPKQSIIKSQVDTLHSLGKQVRHYNLLKIPKRNHLCFHSTYNRNILLLEPNTPQAIMHPADRALADFKMILVFQISQKQAIKAFAISRISTIMESTIKTKRQHNYSVVPKKGIRLNLYSGKFSR